MSKAFFHEYRASFCVHVAISSKSIRTNIQKIGGPEQFNEKNTLFTTFCGGVATFFQGMLKVFKCWENFFTLATSQDGAMMFEQNVGG